MHSLIFDLTQIIELGQKYKNIFVCFWCKRRLRLGHFGFYRPLVPRKSTFQWNYESFFTREDVCIFIERPFMSYPKEEWSWGFVDWTFMLCTVDNVIHTTLVVSSLHSIWSFYSSTIFFFLVLFRSDSSKNCPYFRTSTQKKKRERLT